MALTTSDKKWIADVLDTKLDVSLKNQSTKFEQKLTQLKNELLDRIDSQEDKYENKLTEFKSDFYDKIDPILKEVKDSREERAIINHRLTRLEDIHQKGSHSIANL